MRRALPLIALLVGLLGLHLMSAHDGRAGHHLVTQVVSVSVAQVESAPAVGNLVTDGTAPDTSTDHSTLEMCALLMLAAGVVAGLLRQRRRTHSDTESRAARLASPGVLRGPPIPSSRLVLCVERT